MAKSTRVVVVDDFEPFRRFLCLTLQNEPDIQVICEVSDGIEAVQKAKELHPDIILLDIGLPGLDGMEAARRILKLSPKSKILFVSQETSADVVQQAFSLGASGYLIKTEATSELLTAVDAVLRGERFISSRFVGHDFTGVLDSQGPERVFTPLQQQKIKTARRHEVQFYSDDQCIRDRFAQFIGAALKVGNAAIFVATESHRNSLLLTLQAHGLDIAGAIEEGRYVALDAADTLSTFMISDMPDPVRFLKTFGDLTVTVAKAAKGEIPRVAVCGECAPLLWTQNRAEAAIKVEKLANQLVRIYDVNILCGYSLGSFQGGLGSHIFQRICAEHSAVHSG